MRAVGLRSAVAMTAVGSIALLGSVSMAHAAARGFFPVQSPLIPMAVAGAFMLPALAVAMLSGMRRLARRPVRLFGIVTAMASVAGMTLYASPDLLARLAG